VIPPEDTPTVAKKREMKAHLRKSLHRLHGNVKKQFISPGKSGTIKTSIANYISGRLMQ